MKLNPKRPPKVAKYHHTTHKNGYMAGYKDNGLIAFGHPEPPRFKKEENK